MQMLRWSAIWIFIGVMITGTSTYFFSYLDPAVLQRQIRMVGGLFFMIALIVGGVLTTNSAYRNRKQFFYREDWSFICILVSICLFGISFMKHRLT